MRKSTLFAFVLFLLVVVSADLSMGQTKPASKPKYGGTLVFGIEEDIVSPDTHRPTSRSSRRLISFYSDELVGIGNKYEIVPALAQSWDQSKNGLEYIFHLQKGVNSTMAGK